MAREHGGFDSVTANRKWSSLAAQLSGGPSKNGGWRGGGWLQRAAWRWVA